MKVKSKSWFVCESLCDFLERLRSPLVFSTYKDSQIECCVRVSGLNVICYWTHHTSICELKIVT